VARTVEEFGRLDATALNAAIAGRGGLNDFAPQRYGNTMRSDLDSVVHGPHAALPRSRQQSGGQIVVTGGIAGLTGSPDVFYAGGDYGMAACNAASAPPLPAPASAAGETPWTP
jgi:NAD(P)-dependent dehydrogenase (short-subunit alcohol dehydrogenase family)